MKTFVTFSWRILVLMLIGSLLPINLAEARYYNPKNGRFLQRDPYTQAPNDPRIFDSYNAANRYQTRDYEGLLAFSPELAKSKILSQGSINPLNQHPYLYVRNNPLNYVDPYGKQGLAAVITAAVVAGTVFVITTALIIKGTSNIRAKQNAIASQQGASCPLQKFVDLQDRFEDNRAGFIQRGGMQLITQAMSISGATTPEDQALYLGSELGEAIGEAVQGNQ